MYVDSASDTEHLSGGIHLQGLYAMLTDLRVTFQLCVTNNVAEYEELVARLKMATEVSLRRLAMLNDSQLIVG